MMQKLLFAVILATLSWSAFSKVDPPNYNFELAMLDPYMPNKEVAQTGKSEEVTREGTTVQLRFTLKNERYVFPILAQAKDGKFTDFMARLPQYFSHDLFHQALINKLGKQDSYLKKDETAIYQWKNRDGLRHVYAGACTITCFPIYYAVYPEGGEEKEPKPMLIRFMRLEVAP